MWVSYPATSPALRRPSPPTHLNRTLSGYPRPTETRPPLHLGSDTRYISGSAGGGFVGSISTRQTDQLLVELEPDRVVAVLERVGEHVGLARLDRL